MNLERDNNGVDRSEPESADDNTSDGYRLLHTADGDVLVPAGVLRGIRQISNGETADEDDLDDALSF
ncbi:hypothetical protein [Natrinema thermotolerans]